MNSGSSFSSDGWGIRWSVGLALWSISLVGFGADSPAATKARTFKFYYGATISELPPGTTARIWIPVPVSDHEQTVEFVEARTPTQPRFTQEKKFGNRVLYFEATANDKGEIAVDVEYKVTRQELTTQTAEAASANAAETYLVANRMIPVDGTILKRLWPEHNDASSAGLSLVRNLYDRVDDLMKYDKPDGQPWGRGDAIWACDSRYGNCTDFHSIFIGACRDLKIPAKFEMGFPIPEKRGQGEVSGYHCWAKFVSDGRWIPVDISEADKNPSMKDYYFGNLTENRVKFTEGRDLELDPVPAKSPVNFLIYPYVEVHGETHTKFIKRFRYEDL